MERSVTADITITTMMTRMSMSITITTMRTERSAAADITTTTMMMTRMSMSIITITRMERSAAAAVDTITTIMQMIYSQAGARRLLMYTLRRRLRTSLSSSRRSQSSV